MNPSEAIRGIWQLAQAKKSLFRNPLRRIPIVSERTQALPDAVWQENLDRQRGIAFYQYTEQLLAPFNIYTSPFLSDRVDQRFLTERVAAKLLYHTLATYSEVRDRINPRVMSFLSQTIPPLPFANEEDDRGQVARENALEEAAEDILKHMLEAAKLREMDEKMCKFIIIVLNGRSVPPINCTNPEALQSIEQDLRRYEMRLGSIARHQQ